MRLSICGNLSEHCSEDSYSRVKSDQTPLFCLSWTCGECVLGKPWIIGLNRMRLSICGNLSEHCSEDSYSRVKSDQTHVVLP